MAEKDREQNLRDALTRLTEAQQAVLSASAHLSRPLSTAPVTELIRVLISLLSQLTEYQAACAWKVDETSVCEAQHFGRYERFQAEFARHQTDGLIGWVLESRQVQAVPAAQGCFLLVPLSSETRQYALLDLALACSVDQLTPATLELVASLAAHTALAFERHNLQAWQRQVKRFLDLLPERSTISESATLLQTVVEDIQTLIEVDCCSVMLVEPRTRRLRIAAAAGLPEEFKQITIALGEGLSGRVAQSGQPLFIEDSRRETSSDFTWRDSYEGRSIICLPLRHRQQILGVINATNRHTARRLYRSDSALLELFAAHVTLAWQQAVLIEHLKLESSEWSRLFDAFDEGVLVLNVQGEVLKANRPVASLLATTERALIGQRLPDLLPSLAGELNRFFTSAPERDLTLREQIAINGQPLKVELRPIMRAEELLTGFVCRLGRPTEPTPGLTPAAEAEPALPALLQSILNRAEQMRQAAHTSILAELETIAAQARAGLQLMEQLPAPETPVLPPPVAAPPAVAHVLVVDDEIEMANLLSDILEFAGHKVTAVTSGAEAMRLIETTVFDLVITDLGLPLFTGWEITQAVKRRAPQTPVIIVSGWGADAEPQAREYGVDVILPKPFQVDQVVQAVAQILQR